jgi:hypothetical protein
VQAVVQGNQPPLVALRAGQSMENEPMLLPAGMIRRSAGGCSWNKQGPYPSVLNSSSHSSQTMAHHRHNSQLSHAPRQPEERPTHYPYIPSPANEGNLTLPTSNDIQAKRRAAPGSESPRESRSRSRSPVLVNGRRSMDANVRFTMGIQASKKSNELPVRHRSHADYATSIASPVRGALRPFGSANTLYQDYKTSGYRQLAQRPTGNLQGVRFGGTTYHGPISERQVQQLSHTSERSRFSPVDPPVPTTIRHCKSLGHIRKPPSLKLPSSDKTHHVTLDSGVSGTLEGPFNDQLILSANIITQAPLVPEVHSPAPPNSPLVPTRFPTLEQFEDKHKTNEPRFPPLPSMEALVPLRPNAPKAESQVQNHESVSKVSATADNTITIAANADTPMVPSAETRRQMGRKAMQAYRRKAEELRRGPQFPKPETAESENQVRTNEIVPQVSATADHTVPIAAIVGFPSTADVDEIRREAGELRVQAQKRRRQHEIRQRQQPPTPEAAESSGDFFRRMTGLSENVETSTQPASPVILSPAVPAARLIKPFDPLAETATIHRHQLIEGVRRSATVSGLHDRYTSTNRRPYSAYFDGNGRVDWEQFMQGTRPLSTNTNANAVPPVGIMRHQSERRPVPVPRVTNLPRDSVHSWIAPVAPTPAPDTESKDVKVNDCAEQLKGMGFGKDESRLMAVAQAADGDLEEAIDIMEEDRKAYEEYDASRSLVGGEE